MADARAFFRSYDRGWNRTGWSRERQYPGQEALARDLPLRCHCGAGFTEFKVWADPQWRCANGHPASSGAIADMIADAAHD